MQKGPGFLIAIEGIDGAGKTTQAHFVQERLQSRQLPVIRTKEPTMGHWGQTLRDSALTGRLSLDEEVEAFLLANKLASATNREADAPTNQPCAHETPQGAPMFFKR